MSVRRSEAAANHPFCGQEAHNLHHPLDWCSSKESSMKRVLVAILVLGMSAGVGLAQGNNTPQKNQGNQPPPKNPATNPQNPGTNPQNPGAPPANPAGNMQTYLGVA